MRIKRLRRATWLPLSVWYAVTGLLSVVMTLAMQSLVNTQE